MTDILYLHFTKARYLTPPREIIAVYFENHTKQTNAFCGQNEVLLNVKPSGT
jgi:hypothetical protein